MNQILSIVVYVVLASGITAAETVKWTYPLEASASAPTLFPNETQPTGVVIASGADLIRLNGDGSLVWRAKQPALLATPATVADLDGDGVPEIVAALADGTVVCLDEQGQTRWSHAFATSAGGFKSLVVADLTPHAGLEILDAFDDGWLNCLDANGDLVWRFFGDKFRTGAGCAVGDANGDGAPEIVYATDNGHVYCLDGWGRVVWRYTERAPYGRSGPNLADLDGDGKAEVLITRSNAGNATCLMALNGADGTFLWRTQDMMQGYVSIAVVDFEGDGKLEVLHGDKGNHLYCENADGARRWQVELGGRGMFWAPCVADVDGDGQLEVIASTRGGDPATKASVYVVGADGAIKSAPSLGGGANTAPAVGDIDGDGQLEVVVATENPAKIQVLSWQAGGRVAWPSLRGNSRMTANSGVAPGAPRPAQDVPPAGNVAVETGEAAWGDNRWQLSWTDPVPEDAFLEIAAGSEGRIVDLKPGATRAEVPVWIAHGGAVRVTISLHVSEKKDPLFVVSREVTPQAPDYCRFEEVAQACAAAIAAATAAGADPDVLATDLSRLETERNKIKHLADSGAAETAIAGQATQLRKHAATIERLAGALKTFWTNKGGGDFVCWQDMNPWDRFDPESVPDIFDSNLALQVTAYGNEFEDAVLALRNITSKPIDVRCTFAAPSLGQQPPAKEPDLARRVTLRRAVPVGTAMQDRVFDALPELDLSRSIALPPDEARPLWLVIDTYGLEPGTHELTLYLGSLSKPPTIRAIPVRIEVWPVALPTDVYAKMNWSQVNAGQVSDQAVRDMIEHGVSVVYGPPLPTIPVNAQGALDGVVDWTAFDATLARIPAYFTMLLSGPPPRKWPEGVNPAEDSAEYFTGFQTAIRELAAHLDTKGFGYRQWAFYPIDEPWNTGFTEIPRLKRFCEMVKRADPRAQNYVDPCGLVRVEYLDEFKGLIDIWQPEMNVLKRDPKLVEWFHANAKRFWAYEAPGPAKDLLPLGHYRAFAWLAWYFGLEGAGYWVYNSGDVWWPLADCDYNAVYPANEDVVPSRRWEADRDGVEDYRALYVLRDEIAKARAAGQTEAADQAQALMDEAVEAVIGWHVRNIDEITRMTRDYEVDFDLLMKYRTRIAEEIMRLRGLSPK